MNKDLNIYPLNFGYINIIKLIIKNEIVIKRKISHNSIFEIIKDGVIFRPNIIINIIVQSINNLNIINLWFIFRAYK